MKKIKVFLMAYVLLAMSTQVSAHIGDTIPAKFSDGTQGKAIYTLTGVTSKGNLETAFICTNMNKKLQINIGVEIFSPNGIPVNSIAAINGAIVDVVAGRTVTFSTFQQLQSIVADLIIPLTQDVIGGSARIVSTSPNIVCTAALLDAANPVPTSMLALPIFKKGQKGN